MKQILLLSLAIFLYGLNIKYKEFSADFNQSVKSENKTIKYYGKVNVDNNLVFWHYTKPIKKKIWATLNKVYVYEPDLEQVTIHNIGKNDNFFTLLKTAKKIKNNLYIKSYDNKNIYFIVKNQMITKIYYKDKVDNLVTLNFYNIKPQKFKMDTFTPKYPDYVDIIYSK